MKEAAAQAKLTEEAFQEKCGVIIVRLQRNDCQSVFENISQFVTYILGKGMKCLRSDKALGQSYW